MDDVYNSVKFFLELLGGILLICLLCMAVA